MNPNMIDTLRYADRLKEAGVDARQAEAMSRALNDELAGNVVTKGDLDSAVAELRADTSELRAEMRAGFASVDARFEAVDARFETVDARFDAMESRFDEKIEALADTVYSTSQFTFLILTLVVALGLYNAIAPHFRGREATPAAAAAASPQPEAAHPTDASARTPSASRQEIMEERGAAHASAGSHG